jgi:hypothetical protein
MLGVALLLAVAACGGARPGGGAAAETNPIGDIPDNQAFVAYAPPQGGYTIKVPEGWASTPMGDAVTFTDKLNSINLAAAAAAAPEESAARADIAALKSAPGFGGGGVSTVRRPAGSAVLTTYRTNAPADPVTGKVINDDVERYQFFHGGRLVTVTLSGPHGADNADPWRIVTDSLAWTS